MKALAAAVDPSSLPGDAEAEAPRETDPVPASPPAASRSARTGWWAPRRRSWWIGVLFAVGSACFVIAPFPGFLSLVGAAADAAVFFAGSLFFTSAATLQYLETVEGDHRRSIEWWAVAVQLAGTLLFNLSTFAALRTGLSTAAQNRVIWAPDVFGCIAFLVASALAWSEVRGGTGRRPRRELGWWIAAVNLAGSAAFGVAAIASFVVPATGSVVDLAAANFMTVLGALGFLAGAILLLCEGASADLTAPVVPAPLHALGANGTVASPTDRGAQT